MNAPSIAAPGRTPRTTDAPTVRFERLGLRYGLWTGVAYIVFFLLMKVLGLHERTEVSYLNGLFLIGGIVLALREFKRVTRNHIPYLHGLGTGFLVSLYSSIILALFFVGYTAFDKEFAGHIASANLYGLNLSVIMVALMIILQGTIGGTIIGFIAMQYFKSNDHQLEDPDMAA